MQVAAGCARSLVAIQTQINREGHWELISARRRGGGRAEHAESPGLLKSDGTCALQATTAQLRTE